MRPTKAQQKLSRYYNLVGKLIVKHRNKRGMTVTELAQKSGLRVPQIRNLEEGTGVPNYVTMSRIAKALRIRDVNVIYPDIEL